MRKRNGDVPGSENQLSPRENEILDLAAKGRTDKEISNELGIGVGTVNTYWTRIRGKLGTSSRAEAIAVIERQRASYSLDLKDRENQILAAEVTARREAERKLTETEQMLREANSRLEARIESRTKKLEETMRALQAEVEQRNIAEERLNNAQRIARIASWEINVRTRETFWSKHMYEMYGVTPEEFPLTESSFRKRLSADRLELLDRPHPLEEGLDEQGVWAFRLIRASAMTFVDPEFWEKVFSEIRPLFDAPSVTEYDLRLLRPGRPYVHATGVRQSEFDEQGLRVLRGVLVDATSAFEARQTLLDAERLMQIVLQNASVALVVLDPNGRVRFIGGRALEGLDMPAAGDWSILSAYADRAQALEMFERAIKGQTVVGTTAIRDRRFIQANIPDVSPTGEVIRVIAVLTDITEKQRTDVELGIAHARYSALAEMLEDLVGRIGPDLIVTEANEPLLRLGEVVSGPLIGRDVLSFVAESDRPRLVNAFRSLTKESPQAMWTTDLALGNDMRLFLEWRIQAIFSEEDELVEYQFVGRTVERHDPNGLHFKVDRPGSASDAK